MSCCGSCAVGKPCESSCAAQPHLPDPNPFAAGETKSKKLERCIRDVKKRGGDVNPFAVCRVVVGEESPYVVVDGVTVFVTKSAIYGDGKLWWVGYVDTEATGGFRAVGRTKKEMLAKLPGVVADWRRSNWERVGGNPFEAGETARVLYETTRESAEKRRAEVMPQNGTCGPFARIAVDPAAASSCQRLSDAIGPIDTPQKLYRLVKSEYFTYMNETFVVVPLDVHGQLTMPPVRVGEGQRSRVAVDPADVLRAALLSSCHRYAVVHNHPSNGEDPSPADKRLSATLERAHDACFGREKGVEPTVEYWGHFVVWRGGISDAKTGKQYRVK